MTLHKTDALFRNAPEKSELAAISPDELQSPELRAVFAIWNEHRGDRRAPSRDVLLPKPLRAYLRQLSLVRALPETDDYEFRIVGEAHVQAYGVNSQGRLLSDLIAKPPELRDMLKASYDLVCAQRAPLAYRGIVGNDLGDIRFVWFETIYLPLANESDGVEYVLNGGVYAPRRGIWPT